MRETDDEILEEIIREINLTQESSRDLDRDNSESDITPKEKRARKDSLRSEASSTDKYVDKRV